MPSTQFTFAMIKSDAVLRKDSISILSSIQLINYSWIFHMEYMVPTQAQIDAIYAEHIGKHFYPDLVNSVSRGVVAIVIGGHDVVAEWRKLIGATNPEKALPGTIRYDFGVAGADNAVHGSATKEDADREIGIMLPHVRDILIAVAEDVAADGIEMNG